MLISLIGLTLGFFGSIVLAFSLNPIIQTLRTATNAQELSIETASTPGDTVIFEGFNEQLENSSRDSRSRLIIGSLLLALSFILQAISIIS